jgi:hypothetical protein
MEPLIWNGLNMGLFRKKRNVEGWSDSAVEVGRMAALKESIQNSNRAWLAAMIGIIAIGICLIVVTAKNEQMREAKVPEPPHREHGVFDDNAHRRFITQFNSAMARRGIQTDMMFENSGRVRIVVPVDTGNDEIVDVSATAARAVLRRFHTAPYVNVYTSDNAEPPHEKHVAFTKWITRRNDFVVTLGPQGSKEPED